MGTLEHLVRPAEGGVFGVMEKVSNSDSESDVKTDV